MAEPPDALRMMQPARYGGRAATADEFVAAVGALAAQDASAGWLAAIRGSAAHGLPDRIAGEIWGTDATASVTAGHEPVGRLVRSGRGRRLTGRWCCVAGGDRAEWLLLAAVEDGRRRRVLLPRRDADIQPVTDRNGLPAAGFRDVEVTGLPVRKERIVAGPDSTVAGAALAAAVVGAADGLWRTHVGQVRERLAASYGSEEVTDRATTEVARAAADIDAARLQVVAALRDTPQDAARAHRQAAARARAAADRLLGSSRRHALDASDPVTRLWRDVHAGCRLTLRLLDGLDPR